MLNSPFFGIGVFVKNVANRGCLYGQCFLWFRASEAAFGTYSSLVLRDWLSGVAYLVCKITLVLHVMDIETHIQHLLLILLERKLD